jgi:peptidoglycan/LPS O-acetylase OafA/YrhL
VPACVAALVRLPGPFGTVVRAIGTRSYAIYIVHTPVFEVVSHYIIVAHLPVAVAMLLAPAPIWGLAWAPWRWIEVPILVHRPIRSDPDSPGEAIFYCDTISIQMAP